MNTATFSFCTAKTSPAVIALSNAVQMRPKMWSIRPLLLAVHIPCHQMWINGILSEAQKSIWNPTNFLTCMKQLHLLHAAGFIFGKDSISAVPLFVHHMFTIQQFVEAIKGNANSQLFENLSQ